MSDTDQGLQLELEGDPEPRKSADEVQLRARFRNVGAEHLRLTFWWNRRIEVRDADGALVTPGPGPTLPCGMPETPILIAPGESFERAEGLACTQPAGGEPGIGWGYELPPGTYRARLLFAFPPEHGRGAQVTPHWAGAVTSNDVAFTIVGPPKPGTGRRGFIGRLFGGSGR